MPVRPDGRALKDFLSLGFKQLIAIPNGTGLPQGWPHWSPRDKPDKEIPRSTIAHWIENERLASNWAIKWNGLGANIYFSPNLPTGGLRRKAAKEDIEYACALYVDKDPVAKDPARGHAWTLSEVIEPRAGLPGPPTIVIDSGGGHQALWMLDRILPVSGDYEAIRDYEERNYGLELAIGSDECRNIDRILRVPGTVNWPNSKKLALGRAPRLASLVWVYDEGVYPIEAFPKAQLPAAKSYAADLKPVDSIPLEVLEEMIRHKGIRHLIVNGAEEGEDRSGKVWFLCCWLQRAGFSDSIIYSIITDPQYLISEHILSQTDPNRAALRAIERAHERA